MTVKFNLVESEKHGFRAAINVIVTSEKRTFLRFVGTYPEFSLMAATASENDRSFLVCNNRDHLNICVTQLGVEMGMATSLKRDTSGREFIAIDNLDFTGADNSTITEYLNSVFERFFQLYGDELQTETARVGGVDELYEAIAIDDSGEDCYLGDGVWLSSDGSMDDRGR